MDPTASSGLAVSFASLASPVCAVSGNTDTIVAAGTCTIQPSQSGNANYAAALNINQSFTAKQATLGMPTSTSADFFLKLMTRESMTMPTRHLSACLMVVALSRVEGSAERSDMIEALIVLFLVFVFVVIPVVFFAMVILAAKQGYRAGKIANRVLKRYE